MVPCILEVAFVGGKTPLELNLEARNKNKGNFYLLLYPDIILHEDNVQAESLQAASARGDVIKVRLLLSSNSVDSITTEGLTALHCASFYGHVEIVKLLITEKADVQAVDSRGLTPLHMAAMGCQDI